MMVEVVITKMILCLSLIPKKRMAKKVPNGIESKTGDTAAILLIPMYFFAFIKKRLVRVKRFFILLGSNLRIIYS